MEKLFGMELCEPPAPDLRALMDEPESRALPFRGSDVVKDVDRVADGQTGRRLYPPSPPPGHTKQRQVQARQGGKERGRREAGGGVDAMRDGVGSFF